MDQTAFITGILIQAALGISLAACAGLRAFLPLLVLGILARFQYLQVGDTFAWIGSTPSLIVFGAATLAEILGDKFPAVDHFLDSSGVFVKPIAGTVLFSTVIVKMDPLLAVVLGIIVGGSLAEVIHVKKASLRIVSSSLTGGAGNPILSTIEDVTAGIGIIFSLLAPVLTVFLICLSIFIVYRIYKKICGKVKDTAASFISRRPDKTDTGEKEAAGDLTC